VRERGLADHAERERGERDAELGRSEVEVELVGRALQGARVAPSKTDELGDAAAPDGDEGELRGDEESVRQDENQYRGESEYVRPTVGRNDRSPSILGFSAGCAGSPVRPSPHLPGATLRPKAEPRARIYLSRPFLTVTFLPVRPDFHALEPWSESARRG
jgi:hypothetical protein